MSIASYCLFSFPKNVLSYRPNFAGCWYFIQELESYDNVSVPFKLWYDKVSIVRKTELADKI